MEKNGKIDINAKPLVVSNKNVLYVYEGQENNGFKFRNLESGVSGILNETQSRNLFKTPLELNEIILPYQNLIKLLEAFNGIVTVEKDGIKKQYKV